MKLCVSRSQRASGITKNQIVFCIDARVELSPEEAADVKKYKLGKEVIYNSRRAREQLEKADEKLKSSMIGSAFSKLFDVIKAAFNVAGAKLALNITIDSLVKGHHIEAKDMNEMVDAEQQLHTACANMRQYLNISSSFDGEEEVTEY